MFIAPKTNYDVDWIWGPLSRLFSVQFWFFLGCVGSLCIHSIPWDAFLGISFLPYSCFVPYKKKFYFVCIHPDAGNFEHLRLHQNLVKTRLDSVLMQDLDKTTLPRQLQRYILHLIFEILLCFLGMVH